MTRYKIKQGPAAELLRKIPAETIHAMITDPPASIGYQNREWDKGPDRGAWTAEMGAVFAAALRALTPGAWSVVWAFPRRSHWTALALEDAGYEIRDIVHHVFPQGMPAGLNVELDAKTRAARTLALLTATGMDKDPAALEPAQRLVDAIARGEFAGLRTGLKPAVEHWIVARKPLASNVTGTLLAYGTGAINVDAGRAAGGQWPANVAPEEELDDYLPGHAFWCRKPRWAEKELGCESVPAVSGAAMVGRKSDSVGIKNARAGAGRTRDKVHNDHPTVKAVRLMRHLVAMFAPKNRGTILDPFCGSGSTGVAALLEGHSFLGCDLDARNVQIAWARCAHAAKGGSP